MAGEFLTLPEDNVFGHVGGCIPQNECKLRDVPSMNYFSTDKDEEGNAAPRGEIMVRGGNVIPGYYKNEAKTKETFTEDGWLLSGDIGMIMPGSGALKIVDRVKNIFKLSQGEYVAPDKLEQTYKNTVGVADIFVYGESTKSSLVAVIYCEEPDLTKIASDLGVQGSFQEMIEDQKVVDHFK